MELTRQQTDVTVCARDAAKAVGLYSGWNISLEEFRSRPCSDLIDSSGASCPIDEDFDDLVLLNFFGAVRNSLKQCYPAPVVLVSAMCASFDGNLPTWGVWCDFTASFLGDPQC